MEKTTTSGEELRSSSAVLKQVAIVMGASLFVALCGRLSVPLPFTPIPLTLANFGVILVGLALGARRGFLALALYLAEGVSGIPVFSPAGPGGIAQLLGPTGGYLMAYPLVAGLAGRIAERGSSSFLRNLAASVAGEVVLFTLGIGWLALLTHAPLGKAAYFGVYPFLFAEVIKVMTAAALALRLKRGPLTGSVLG
ncbi:MAG TPA: biotin transporter BioY [Terriglobales bacterium]|nr:biotin transporter BioY [Terriglobales bacterium]